MGVEKVSIRSIDLLHSVSQSNALEGQYEHELLLTLLLNQLKEKSETELKLIVYVEMFKTWRAYDGKEMKARFDFVSKTAICNNLIVE